MKEFFKKNWISMAIVAAGILVIVLIVTGLIKPEIDASFNLRNIGKNSENLFMMSVGEETVLEWEIKPEISGVKLELPDGLEYLDGDLVYRKGNEGIGVRAVRVGKWQLKVAAEIAEYSPTREYFVCIGVTDEDARKYCD